MFIVLLCKISSLHTPLFRTKYNLIQELHKSPAIEGVCGESVFRTKESAIRRRLPTECPCMSLEHCHLHGRRSSTLGLYSLNGRTFTLWSCEAPKPLDSGLGFSNRFEIWQKPRQYRYRHACQIAERYDHHNIARLLDFTKSCGKTSIRLVNRGPAIYTVLYSYICICICWLWQYCFAECRGEITQLPHCRDVILKDRDTIGW